MRTFIIMFILLTVLLIGIPVVSQQKSKKPEGKKSTPSAILSYKKDIAPIFRKYCLPCHTEDQMNPSELYLDTYDNMMAGGKHGKPIMSSKADSSFLIEKISAKPPFGDPMPMKRKTPFPEDTLKMVRKWIDQGAKNN